MSQTVLPDITYWTIAKWLFVTVIPAVLGWSIKSLVWITREFQKMQHTVYGVDGKDGMRDDVRVLKDKVQNIEIEYAGEERRREDRRR